MRRLLLLVIYTKKPYLNYMLKTKIFPKLNENETVTQILRTEKETTLKNQNENFYFCKATNLTNVKNSKCIRYNIN